MLNIIASLSYATLLLFAAPAQEPHKLIIDIPVTIEHADVAYNAGRLTWDKDTPFQLEELRLLATAHAAGAKGEMIAIFHGDSGYVLLNDEAYNKFRNTDTGNPYKETLIKLMAEELKLEECGATAAENGWVNTDFLPGIKVNTNAMLRFIQLEEKGYIYI